MHLSDKTFFFYDLETSGVDPRRGRIMQFAGQRTDEQLQPIGEEVNVLIKLTEDVLPDPYAILVTGITPQQTLADGVSEAEFVKIFNEQIWQPNTTFAGFNNIRFDDEFMRFTFWRNFNDSYEWQWKDGCSRWDILDLSRMMRALRPEGIKWPFAADGKPTNRLEYLSAVNNLDHADAHDALSDVKATMGLARLIKQKQPKLFDFLFQLRAKDSIKEFIEANKIFVYSSGKYPGEFEKTTVVANLMFLENASSSLVYDLRHDPRALFDLSVDQLVERWTAKFDSGVERLPLKAIKFNRAPAIAPRSVLDPKAAKTIKINLSEIDAHYKLLQANLEFIDKLAQALDQIEKKRLAQAELIESDDGADGSLYEGFLSSPDKKLLSQIRSAEPDKLLSFQDQLKDNRLKRLLPLYKARNYPHKLSEEEAINWREYRYHKLISGAEKSKLAEYYRELQKLQADSRLNKNQRYVVEELVLWADAIQQSFEV